MAQLTSALFIDYDNVVSELAREDARTLLRFEKRPSQWLADLEAAPPPYTDLDSYSRRIISRRCYSSPGRIERNRSDYTRSGFEVIDCPPLTSQLKNSADIYIVMDVIEFIGRYPHIDEYIILSADADFTPVINKLRREMKRTAIFAPPKTAGAFKNCSDWLIPPEFFSAATPAPAVESRSSQSPSPSSPRPPVPSGPTAASPAQRASEALSAHVDDLLFEVISMRAGGRANFAYLAPHVRNGAASLLGADYAGYKTFLRLLKSLDLERVEVDWASQSIGIPGFIAPPIEATPVPEWLEKAAPDLRRFIEEVREIYKIPLITERSYSCIFEELAPRLLDETLTSAQRIKKACEACSASEPELTESAVRFVHKGVLLQGIAPGTPVTATGLAAAFRFDVFELCGEPEWMTGEEAATLLCQWIHAQGESLDEARAGLLQRMLEPVTEAGILDGMAEDDASPEALRTHDRELRGTPDEAAALTAQSMDGSP